MNIAIIGGTGKLGAGFVSRLLNTGHEVAIGSRDIAKAEQAAAAAGDRVYAMSNADAAVWCNMAVLTIPYAGHHEIVAPLGKSLAGKVIVDATVPLNPLNIFEIVTESGNSVAEETASLADEAHVFAAFQTISHRILRQTDRMEDVLVAGSPERKPDVMQLIRDLKLRPINAGPLEAARLIEHITVLLISINKQYRVKESGFRITGV